MSAAATATVVGGDGRRTNDVLRIDRGALLLSVAMIVSMRNPDGKGDDEGNAMSGWDVAAAS